MIVTWLLVTEYAALALAAMAPEPVRPSSVVAKFVSVTTVVAGAATVGWPATFVPPISAWAVKATVLIAPPLALAL